MSRKLFALLVLVLVGASLVIANPPWVSIGRMRHEPLTTWTVEVLDITPNTSGTFNGYTINTEGFNWVTLSCRAKATDWDSMSVNLDMNFRESLLGADIGDSAYRFYNDDILQSAITANGIRQLEENQTHDTRFWIQGDRMLIEAEVTNLGTGVAAPTDMRIIAYATLHR